MDRSVEVDKDHLWSYVYDVVMLVERRVCGEEVMFLYCMRLLLDLAGRIAQW